VQFTATGNFDDGTTQDVTVESAWSSSDTGVAQISNAKGTKGRADAVNPGTATITASLMGISGSGLMSVGNYKIVSVVVTPHTATVPAGGTFQLQAIATWMDPATGATFPLDVTTQAHWTSRTKSVASVINGLVTVLPGTASGSTANIFAQTNGRMDDCTVTAQ
jgi:hypothetical protein